MVMLTPVPREQTDHLQSHYQNLLGQSERLRWQQFRGRRQQEFLYGRVALRTALSYWCPQVPLSGWCIEERKDQAPLVFEAREAGCSYSISHSRGWVAVAISPSMPVGIDIEAHKPRNFVEFASHWFHPEEAKLLNRYPVSDQAPVFYELWTLKEAYIKFAGLDLFSDILASVRPLPAVCDDTESLACKEVADKVFGLSAQLGDLSLALVTPQAVEVETFSGQSLQTFRTISVGYQKFVLPALHEIRS